MSKPLPPNEPFKPYVPSAAEPWNVRRVSHLFRRTCFGASWAETHAAIQSDPRRVIHELFDFDVEQDEFNDLLNRMEGLFDVRDVRRTQEWWFYRFLNTSRPMQERMAMFWHGHFATSASKVGSGEVMHAHIELFRRMGLGNFRDLLLNVGRDAAMLIWLDGRFSRKGTPNENYAREVMELFTLGPGHYTEQDIRELSRAFTGWEQKGVAGEFNPSRFDEAEKTVLGKTGPLNDEQAVDLLLSQDAAPPFIATKLLAEFVHPQPLPEHVAHVAKLLREHKWALRPVLKEIVSSRLFFSDYAYRCRVKSPVELVIGAVRAAGGKAKVNWMRDETSRMGQDVLFPPNVGGWNGDRAWINANTMLIRFNFGLKLARQFGGEFSTRTQWREELSTLGLSTYQAVLDHLSDRLLGDRLPDAEQKKLVDYLSKNEKGEPREFKLDGYFDVHKTTGLLHLLMTTPQAQMA